MKRISYISMSVLQVLLVVAAYLVQDFSTKRMGMMRHVIFTNQQWETRFPIETMKYAFVILSVILTVFILYLEFKDKKIKKGRVYRVLETTLSSSVVLGMIMIYSTEKLIAYYYVCLLFVVILTIQYIKHFLKLKEYKKGSI